MNPGNIDKTTGIPGALNCSCGKTNGGTKVNIYECDKTYNDIRAWY